MKNIARIVVSSTHSNYRQLMTAGQHQFAADEPVSMGGQDSAPAPYDYILAGLGSCTTITLKMYADRKGWNLGEIRLELALQKDENGKAMVERVLYSSESLDEGQWQRLLEIAGKTPVTKTLLASMDISTRRGHDIP